MPKTSMPTSKRTEASSSRDDAADAAENPEPKRRKAAGKKKAAAAEEADEQPDGVGLGGDGVSASRLSSDHGESAGGLAGCATASAHHRDEQRHGTSLRRSDAVRVVLAQHIGQSAGRVLHSIGASDASSATRASTPPAEAIAVR